jgi:hypothetical protein
MGLGLPNGRIYEALFLAQGSMRVTQKSSFVLGRLDSLLDVISRKIGSILKLVLGLTSTVHRQIDEEGLGCTDGMSAH